MNCKYLKQKLNRKLECKYKNKIIDIKECSNCIYREYNCTKYKDNCANKDNKNKKSTMIVQKSNNHQIPNMPINKDNQPIWVKKTPKLSNKSKKLAKLERNRTSILTDDLEHCIICGKSPVNKHEIFYGKNRLKSIEYGLVIPLCTKEHHNQVEKKGIHFDSKLCKEWHIKGQKKFNEFYPKLDFVEIFGRNYL